jgi:hypothetical protein
MEAFTGFLTNPALALAGLVLGAVPIIIHLLNRTFYDRRKWAAMEFLLKAEQKTRRRVRLENLLLMLLRYLLLALLGLALAQPFLNEPALAVLGNQQKHVVIVIDQSYSMRATGGDGTSRYDEAKNEAVRVLENQFRPANGDRVTILSDSAYPEQLIGTPSQDRARALRMVRESEPTFYEGNVLESTALLNRTLDKTPDNLVQKVIWITDLQKNTWLPEDQNRRDQLRDELEQITERVNEFAMVDVGAGGTTNLSAVELTSENEFMTQNRPIRFSTRVRNYADTSQSTSLSLYRDDREVETVNMNLEPGETAEKQFNPIRFQDVGPHSVHVQLSGDGLDADNKRYRALRIEEHVNVLMVDGQPGEGSRTDGETYFLRSALQPGERTTPFQIEVVTDYQFRDQDLSEFDLVVLANLSNITEDRREELRTFTERGGGVMLFMGDQTTIKTFNQTLFDIEDPLLPGKLLEVIEQSPEQGNYVTLNDLSLDHPALSFFRPYPEKLRGLMTFGWMRMEIPQDALNVEVLARFNDPDASPAIAERSIGRGSFITVLTSADMGWNYWPEFQGYVMLIDQLSRYLLRQKEESTNVRVGGDINLPVSVFDSSRDFRVVHPDERVSVKSPRPLRDGGHILRLEGLNQPGIYRIEKEGAEEATWEVDRSLAANVSNDEGDLERLSRENMTEQYSGISFESFQETETSMSDGSRSNLWTLFATLVLVFLGLESLLALRIDRKRQV